MTPDISADAVSSEKWAIAMRRLPADEQAGMILAAETLLRHPEAVSTPLEAELLVFREQAHAARPGRSGARPTNVSQ